MKILAIESATAVAGVCALETEQGTSRFLRERVTTHSERLLPLVEGCLAAMGWGARDLDGVVCGAGPGSFTGLRIGCATAKGLCFALSVPLVMVSSLEALGLAHAHAHEGARAVLACTVAFRAMVYARLLHAEQLPARAGTADEERLRLGEDALWHPAALAEALRPIAAGLVVCGDAPARHPEVLVPGAVAGGDPHPHPLWVARLGARRLLAGQSDALAQAAPRYLAPSAAEQSLPAAVTDPGGA